MTMRNLIDLIEAKAPQVSAATYGSPEYYRRYANPQAAQNLARFRQQAVRDITFNMSLVQKAVVATKVQSAIYHRDMQAEDSGSIDPHYDLTAFMDALIHQNDNRHIPDMDARLNDFQNRKPDVEQSDELAYFQAENRVMKEFEFWCDPTDARFMNFVQTLTSFGDMLASQGGSYSHGLDEGLRDALAAHLPVVLVFLALCNGADASKWLG